MILFFFLMSETPERLRNMFLSSFKQVVFFWKVRLSRKHTGSIVSWKLQNGPVFTTFILILNKSLKSLHFIHCQVVFQWKKFHNQKLLLHSQVHPGTREQHIQYKKPYSWCSVTFGQAHPKVQRKGSPVPSACYLIPVHPGPSHYPLYNGFRRDEWDGSCFIHKSVVVS